MPDKAIGQAFADSAINRDSAEPLSGQQWSDIGVGLPPRHVKMHPRMHGSLVEVHERNIAHQELAQFVTEHELGLLPVLGFVEDFARLNRAVLDIFLDVELAQS